MLLVVVVLVASTATLLGQGAKDQLRARVEAMPGTAAIKAFITSRVASGFTPPKTPWGDPDISGNFDTSPEANTPIERPDEWAGRKMDDITPRELAEAIQGRQQRAVEGAWTVTLDDSTTWTRPWTYSYPMTVNDAKPIFEYACHEGNFGMANLLTAGRLADKQGGFGVR
jgi:hypothetical protein